MLKLGNTQNDFYDLLMIINIHKVYRSGLEV